MKVAIDALRRFALPWWAQVGLIIFLGAIGVLDLTSVPIPLPG